MQLDAYTLRKMAPRLLIAVIAVNISIYLCLAAVDLTNIVGRGLGQLLITPFQEAEIFDIKLKDNVSNGATAAGGVVAGAVGINALVGSLFAAAAVGGTTVAAEGIALIGGLLPFILGVIVAVALVSLAVLFTVIIRQGLLVFLIIVAPIAIALFVLPGTEKFFRQWWSIFLKTLMVYPIIAAIFTMSDVLAAIILDGATKSSVTGVAGLAMIMTGIIVIYAPLFLIPFAFKFAGGVLGAMHDIAQGQTGKASGGLRQRIRKSTENENSFLGRRAARARTTRKTGGLTAGTVFPSLSHGVRSFSRGQGFRQGYAQRRGSLTGGATFDAATDYAKTDTKFQRISGDDDKLWASLQEGEAAVREQLWQRGHLVDHDGNHVGHRFGTDRNSAEMNAAVAEIMDARKGTSTAAYRIAATRAMPGTGTGIVNAGQMVDMILDASGGDETTEIRMLQEMRESAKNAERLDLYGGFTDSASQMSQRKASLDAVAAGGVETHTADQVSHEILQSSLRGNGSRAVLGRIQSITQLAPVMLENANAALASGDQRTAATQLAILANRYDAASQASDQNAQEFSNQVLSQEIDIATLTPEMRALLAPALVQTDEHGVQTSRLTGTISYSQAITAARGNADFQSVRREYQSELAGQRPPEAP